ncbi:uncharacterized protein LOC144451828 [Glandiceps talaboti]
MAALVLNALNIDWERTHIAHGIMLCVVLAILQSCVMELVMNTLVTFIFRVRGWSHTDQRADYSNLTLIMAYNLLALSESDIDETFEKMFEAFMGNLSENISIVLISATGNSNLKQYEIDTCQSYRNTIYETLLSECYAHIYGRDLGVDTDRLKLFWQKYSKDSLPTNTEEFCAKIANEFMLIHRVSRVLRKCGQYQDLIQLSSGDDKSYTYTDKEYYGKMARTPDEPLFHDCHDVTNLVGRHFDYTLVLDGDTGVAPGVAHELLAIAAGNPEKGLIQPAVIMNVDDGDTLFMHLEKIRQQLSARVGDSMNELFGQCGFFGKALIKNQIYLEQVIGKRGQPLEKVPVDVLSHDTFEAAILKPYYAGCTFLLEAPCYNYITWGIRERRWNKGEILLSMYFWRTTIGRLMRWLQSIVQGSDFNATKVRTECEFDFVSKYIAHSAIRMMFMKPLLLLYAFLQINAHVIFPHLPLAIIMFLVLVFPKLAILSFNNIHLVLLETFSSILQFTPEAIVGCVRLFQAIQANIWKHSKWIPQRAVEEEFMKSNAFTSSFKHLWGYSLFSAILIVIFAVFAPHVLLIYFLLMNVFLLPLFTALTSLKLKRDGSRKYYVNNTRKNFSRVENMRSLGILNSDKSYSINMSQL